MREKFGGWTGKILRIDVTNRSTRIIRTKPYSERFIGGLGIAAKIAWDEIKPEMDRGLLQEKVFVKGVRPPAVPAGKCRPRVTVMATHTRQDLDYALEKFEEVGKTLGLIR